MAESIEHVLHELEPVVASELDRHLSTAEPWMPHEYIPWSEGRNYAALGGEAWSPDQSRLSPVVQAALFVNLLTEDNLPSYHYEIATQFGRESAWGEWVGRWTAEEARHGTAMRDYLLVTRAIDPESLETARMAHMVGGYDSGNKTPLETIAYVTMQELATRISHRNTGKVAAQDGDEQAERLLARIAKDENLHMVFYRNLGKAALELEPDAMMRAITTEVQRFKMPGATIPGFLRHSAAIANAGIYDQQLHLDEVLRPVLKYWGIFDREDLSDDGNAARDELAVAMDSLKTAADRFVSRRAARQDRG